MKSETRISKFETNSKHEWSKLFLAFEIPKSWDVSMKAMRVELAFFERDDLLTRAMVLIDRGEETTEIESERGDRFQVTRQFEEPASRLFIKCFAPDGELVGRSAMRMGVHNSDDWEAVELAEPYQLCFRCAIVDGERPDWATQKPVCEDDFGTQI